MPESTDPKLTEQLKSICNGYARREQLSDEAREEVFAHLEDTLNGYLTGAARLNPEEALLLARARLGDVKGVIRQLQSSRFDYARQWARPGVAVATGFLTVVMLPLALMFAMPPAGPSSDFHRLMLLLPLFFLTLEGGVFLAARTNMRSLWQRAAALLLMLPAIGYLGLVSVLVTHGILISMFGSALFHGVALACLAGHAALALMLIVPTRRERALMPVQ